MKPQTTTCYIILLFWGLLPPVSAISGDGDALEKWFPRPVVEMKDVVSSWLRLSGYAIRQESQAASGIKLLATREKRYVEIEITPHSPLACHITAKISGEDPTAFQQELWDYLSSYLTPPTQPMEAQLDVNQRIPVAVLSKAEAVVCIQANLAKKDTQISGFIVDPGGLILCTAHELNNTSNLIVTLYDGRQVQGRVLLRDKHQDIALVHMETKSDKVISLREGRNLLGMGENIFTVGCPKNMRGTIYAGTITGPPRLVDNLPLWQANIQIHPGSSGSPVLDAQGNLVAMVKGRYRRTTTMGFLIPLETITGFLKESSPL
ncbi:MAG: trypsin-like peptidase domain-containing protein [Deltaproteobacteria bacterium]|nr:trypsin-like peptidase domain-containing protein [Deltaproteobacteria bacterium]